MWTSDRRVFLGGMGSSMLAVGLDAPRRLGLCLGRGDDVLSFGKLEPLVTLMQEKQPDELQAILVDMLRQGADLESFVAAGTLANARTFGGEDYTGYHCQMALVPAYEMSRELPEASRPLPVLKVLYRNAARIQECGGRSDEVLHALPEEGPLDREDGVRRLRQAVFECDVEEAERTFARLAAGNPHDAYDDLQAILLENLDVHRVVLSWRSWEVLQLTGEEHAHTLLRQSVRFCVEAEARRQQRGRPEPQLRKLLPELIERHGLERETPTVRRLSDAQLEQLAAVVFASDKADAAEAMAEALASGVSQRDAGEALTLAANTLLLNDPGRRRDDSSEKPKGSVHGASVGVHASDSARAWRHIALVSNHRNAMANLVAGAYHTAGQSGYVESEPFPYQEHMAEVKTEDAEELLRLTRACIEDGDQERTCALVQRYCDLGHAQRPLYDLMLGFAVSEDGALHAEKYYFTCSEEARDARPAFKSRQAVSLARVTASEHGFPAPGQAAARAELGV